MEPGEYGNLVDMRDGFYWTRHVDHSEWVVSESHSGFIRNSYYSSSDPNDYEIGSEVEYPIRGLDYTKWYHAATQYGRCTFLARPELRSSGRRKIIFIHGLGRHVRDLTRGFSIAERYGDVVLMCLPGFAPSEMIADPTVQNITSMFLEALDMIGGGPSAIVVGESLGGLIAMGMSRQVSASIVIDPPLSLDDQWPVREMEARYGVGGDLFPSPLFELCMGRDDDKHPISYMDMVYRCSKNTCFICGSVPLLPPRPLPNAPSLVKAEEREIIRSQGLRLEIVEGGHDLFLKAAEAVDRIIVREIRAATQSAA
jgi:hypothetical protein